MEANKYVAAAVWIVALDTILAWWVKGDLELAWVIAVPVILGVRTGRW